MVIDAAEDDGFHVGGEIPVDKHVVELLFLLAINERVAPARRYQAGQVDQVGFHQVRCRQTRFLIVGTAEDDPGDIDMSVTGGKRIEITQQQ